MTATHGSSCTTTSGLTLCADKVWPRPEDATATLHVAAGEMCPKSAGRACAGTSSVRVHGRLVARKAFEGLAVGEHRNLSALIRPLAKGYLRNHPAATLRATVSRSGG